MVPEQRQQEHQKLAPEYCQTKTLESVVVEW
jgi:hypothetical protein